MTRKLSFSGYIGTTWRDWQFGPGFYLGSHLELSLYLGPWSFNLQIELERRVEELRLSKTNFDDFRGMARWNAPVDMRLKEIQSGVPFTLPKVKYDPFTHKPYRYKVYRPKPGDKW